MSVAFAYSCHMCAVWARWRIGRDHCDTETERAFAILIPWSAQIREMCLSQWPCFSLFLSHYRHCRAFCTFFVHLSRAGPSNEMRYTTVRCSHEGQLIAYASPTSTHKHSSLPRSFYDYHNLLNLNPSSTCSVPVDELTLMCSRHVAFPPGCDMHDIGWDLHEPHRKLNFQCNEL